MLYGVKKMIKKKTLVFAILVMFILPFLCGCEEKEIIVGTGTIHYIELEGGFYGIVADTGEKYDPINLPTGFKEDGLKVAFKVGVLKNNYSIHMWGIVVKVIEIKKIDENTGNNTKGTLVNYTGCKEQFLDTSSTRDCINYSYDAENTLYLRHVNAGFNCCPEITADINVSNHTIVIKEIELSGECDCLCLFDLEYMITSVTPGVYVIKIIEPYVHVDDKKIEFIADLVSNPEGFFCVERNYYPWGE